MAVNAQRFFKKTFIRLHLHVITGFLNGFFSQLLWMNRFSKWVHSQDKSTYNDFPSKWNYEKRYGLYKYIIHQQNISGAIDYLEFGVADGHSFRWWLHAIDDPEACFYGFDTFTGLPEDFGPFKKGTFDTGNSAPDVEDTRCQFFPGLFQQTLPEFLKNHALRRRKIIMLDADLYSSTSFVLSSLSPYLKEGDVLFFDEFSIPTHEFRAFYEFKATFYIPLELAGAASNYYFTAFIIGKRENSA